jgi:hypothetical protein
MGLDIRWPIGLMFALIGALLTGYGVTQQTASTVQVAGSAVNINLIWGVVLLVFGALMLFGAVRGGKNPPSA